MSATSSGLTRTPKPLYRVKPVWHSCSRWARAPGCCNYSTSVVGTVIGAPTAPRGRIIRRRRIIPSRRIVCRGWRVVAVRIIIRVRVVGICEHGPKRKGSEAKPDGGTRADPTPPRTCGLRHRRQPDSGKDRRGDGQPSTSFPKNPSAVIKPSYSCSPSSS